jgi:hypothetical protein
MLQERLLLFIFRPCDFNSFGKVLSKTKCSYSLEDFRVSLSKDLQEPIFYALPKAGKIKKY